MRVSAVTRLRIRNAHGLQNGDGLLTRRLFGQAAVRLNQPYQLVANARDRLQRSSGVLGHKADAGAAHFVERRALQGQQVHALEHDLTLDFGRGRQ